MSNNKLLLTLLLLPLAFVVLDNEEIQAAPQPALSIEPFVGEIKYVGFNFAPRGWALCDGQLLSISEYSALFSLLGTTYGGDGRKTFGLPDLRGRVPIHKGTGPGLSERRIGARSGAETVTLTAAEMPSHTHAIDFTETRGDANDPVASLYLSDKALTSAAADMELNSMTQTGGSQAHNNMPPYLTMNAVIALQGIFPSRN